MVSQGSNEPSAAISSPAITAAFSALYRDFLRPMTPGPIMNELIEATFDREVQAPELARIIESDPLYAHYIQKLDFLQEKIEQWREEFPEDVDGDRLVRFIVVLLGSRAIRHAVCTIWINRHTRKGLPRKPGEPFLVLPRAALRYSLAAAEFCDEHGIADSDRVSLAALCFDWVAALLEDKGGEAKTEKRNLEALWIEGLRVGRIAYELASSADRLNLSALALPGVLLLELGRILMAASFPSREGREMGWKEHLRHCESLKRLQGFRSIQGILERRRFPWTHAEAASLCALLFRRLAPAEAAIRCYAEPYVLRRTDPESMKLAVILDSAFSLVQGDKALLSPNQLKELEALGIGEQEIDQVLSRVKGPAS